MGAVLDSADRAAGWLRAHVAVAAGMAVVIVGALVVLAIVRGGGGDDGPKIPAAAVATVGDTPITEASLKHWQAVYTKADTTKSSTAAQIRKQAFATLTQSAWVSAEAQRRGVKVTDAQVDAAVKSLVSQYQGATETQVLQASGMSKADLQWTERIALLTTGLQQKVAKSVPAASSADIAKAYAAEPARWAHPSTRDLRMVVTSDEATAEQALAALKSGQTFTTVVKKYSPNTTLATQGGAVKGVKPGSEDATFERPIFTAKQGVVTGPVKTSSGWIVFRVQKIVPSADQSLSAATTKIKADLANTRQQAAITAYLTDLQKRSKSQTTCRASVSDTQFCSSSV